jgi:hypothetical protein
MAVVEILGILLCHRKNSGQRSRFITLGAFVGHPNWRLLLLVCLGLSCGLTTSCHRRIDAPDPAALDGFSRQFSEGQQSSESTADLDVYVDNSGSMRGFVSDPESNYSRLIREMLQAATANQFNLQVIRFSEGFQRVDKLPLGVLQSPEFYNGKDTPLTELLRRLAESPNRSTIVISDLVQSEKTADSVELVKALGGLAKIFPEMKLLAYRSSFAGSYFPESRRKKSGVFPLTVEQTLPGSGRPFYLLVVSPNQKSMKRLWDSVLSRMPAVEAFDPTSAPINLESSDLVADGPWGSIWSLYSPATLKEAQSGRRLDAAYSIAKAIDETSVVLPVAFQTKLNLPLRRPGGLGLDVHRATWTGKAFGAPTEAEIPLQGEFDKAGKLRLRLSLRKPEVNTWDVYHIKISPGQGNLNPPAWIKDWDTEDDSDAATGNRTFQLKLIAEAMTNAITERVVFCQHVLSIGRSK